MSLSLPRDYCISKGLIRGWIGAGTLNMLLEPEWIWGWGRGKARARADLLSRESWQKVSQKRTLKLVP